MKWTRILMFLCLLPLANCSCEDNAGSGTNGTPCTNDGECVGQCGSSGNCVDSGFRPGWQGDGGIVVRDGGVVITDPNGDEFVCYETLCNGKLLECGNCADDDGDGFTDWRDRECLGPCDNTEGPTLTAGIGGESGGPCKADCYFDFGNGSGNDDCHWDHRCDVLSVDPNFDPEGPDCAYDMSMVGGRDCPNEQSDTCLDFCRPLTPNGCDCFGCCIFPELEGIDNGNDRHVWIGSMDDDKEGTCTFDKIEDTTACRPCTPVTDCWNDCQRCEICIGKPDVPDDCFVPAGGDDMGNPNPDMGSPPINPGQCPEDVQACGLAGQPDCVDGEYCVSGCCRPVPT